MNERTAWERLQLIRNPARQHTQGIAHPKRQGAAAAPFSQHHGYHRSAKLHIFRQIPGNRLALSPVFRIDAAPLEGRQPGEGSL